MPFPIDSFDIVDLIIRRETVNSEIHSNLSNQSVIELDNTGNIERNGVFTLNLNNSISSMVLSNITTGKTISLSNTSTLVLGSGSVFTIYEDSAYSGISEVSSSLNGIFSIGENAVNSIRVNISPASTRTIDIGVDWVRPSDVSTIVSYVEGFAINENRNVRKGGVNLLNKYASKYNIQDINFDFSIDKMWLNDWFHEEDPDETYNIKWETDPAISDIEQQVYYLSGVSFNNLSWNQANNEVVKEGVRGNFCKKFKG